MIWAIAALLIAGDVRDFFPLNPGTKWTYETSAASPKVVSVQEAAPAELIDGVPSIPVRTKIAGQVVETLYYQAKEDTLFLVAYKASKPFDEPRPMLVLPGSAPAKWTYETNEDGIPLKVQCEAAYKGRRVVMDRETDILELKVDALLGDETSIAMSFKQTALYARGIGMIDMSEDRKVNKRSHKRRIRLSKFEPGEAR